MSDDKGATTHDELDADLELTDGDAEAVKGGADMGGYGARTAVPSSAAPAAAPAAAGLPPRVASTVYSSTVKSDKVAAPTNRTIERTSASDRLAAMRP
jgi:hypothetical protein